MSRISLDEPLPLSETLPRQTSAILAFGLIAVLTLGALVWQVVYGPDPSQEGFRATRHVPAASVARPYGGAAQHGHKAQD